MNAINTTNSRALAGRFGRRTRTSILIVTLSVLTVAGLQAQNPVPTPANSPNPTAKGTKGAIVMTEKTDYPPGEDAAIWGAGFQPGEVVQLQVTHYHKPHGDDTAHAPWDVTADSEGKLRTTWHVCEDDCLGELLQLSALGKTSGSRTASLFTDGPSLFEVFNSVGQGWFDQFGQHFSWNPNYFVGREAGLEYRNFFTFDLSGLDLTGRRLVGVTLSVILSGTSEVHNQELFYDLFEVSTPRTILLADHFGSAEGQAAFNDLGTGDTYGSHGPRPATGFLFNFGPPLQIPLNAVARSAVAASPSTFAVGGSIRGLSQTTGAAFLFGGSGGAPQQLILETRAADDPDPVARCTDRTASVGGADCAAVEVSVDNGSFDPEGLPLTITQDPPGPYSIGTHTVQLTVVNTLGLSDSCSATITVLPPPVACISVASAGACLESSITLSQPDFSGEVSIPGTEAGVPKSLTFEILNTSCGPADILAFYLNDHLLGETPADPTSGCTCLPTIQTFAVTDSAAIADHWQEAGNNVFRIVKNSGNTAIAWARVRLPEATPFCIFDWSGGSCGEPNLCDAQFTFGLIDESSTLVAPFIAPLVSASYQDSQLPSQLDISSLPAGTYALCVSGARPGQASQQDCIPFVKDSEPRIIINGPGQCALPSNRPPLAKCRDVTVDAGADCMADASIDAGSFDPDGDEITIRQEPPGPFSAGFHFVELTVTDSHGESSSCFASVFVREATPPTITCPGDIFAATDPGLCSATVTYSVEAQDDCSGVTVDCFPPSGSSFDVGSWFVNCNAFDGSGNFNFCGFLVTVQDTEPPQVVQAPIVRAGLFADFGAELTLQNKDYTPMIDAFDATPGLDGDSGFDFFGPYRPSTDVEASKGNLIGGGDQDRSPRAGREIIVDWVIGWSNPGEWCNYTRTFPEGDYNVFVRWGSGDFAAPMNAELSEVTSDPTQPNQTTQRIGTFHNPEPTGGWDGFFISSPLLDDSGQPATVHLGGKKTLRFTLGQGAFLDWNYLLFVEAGGQQLYIEAEDFNYTEIEQPGGGGSCQNLVVTAAPGQCAQTAEWIITDNCGVADQTLPPGTFVSGVARIDEDGSGNGVLHLTDNGQFFEDGLFVIFDPAQGAHLNELTVRWRSLIGGATSGIEQFGRLGADGYSFNWSFDPFGVPFGRAEEGTFSGLSVTIDTWDNTANFEGEDSPAPGINIKYNGQVLAFDNLADQGDQGAAKDFLRKNQFVDAQLAVAADGQVTFTFDGRVLTGQIPDWFGMAGAGFSFGGSVGGATDNHWIDDLSIVAPGLDYRLDFGVPSPCNPPAGSSFPVGVNPVNCTATDFSGNIMNCSFNVIVLGSVCGRKFYDANLNGVDDNEPGLAGWKIVITHESGAEVATYTDETGHYCVEVLPGTQTVMEVPPADNWVNTTPSSRQVTVSADNCRPIANFGNVCLGAGGGLTHGYWSNDNGRNSMTTDPDGGGMSANLGFLRSLNLRAADGRPFDPAKYATFSGWLGSVSSVNGAYMLSVQLAAMQLNVRLGGPRDAIFDAGAELAGGVNGNLLIYAPGTRSANALGFATVKAVMAEANTELGLHGLTLNGSPYRAYQEALQIALDNANNNLSFLQPAPCAFSSAY